MIANIYCVIHTNNVSDNVDESFYFAQNKHSLVAVQRFLLKIQKCHMWPALTTSTPDNYI